MPLYHEPQADTSPLRLRHHYFYIIFWTLLSSVILYLPGGLTYIDALLLASGAATQTGLNPIDLKKLHLAQQVTLWLVPMVTNVVFLHSLLVLIRIYWFRKRFQSAIRDAKAICHDQRRKMNQRLEFEERRPIGLNRTITDNTTNTTSTACDSSDRDDEEQPLLSDSDDSISPGASPPTHGTSRSPAGYQTFKPAAVGPSSPRITFYESNRDNEARQKRRSSFSRRRSFTEAVNEAFPLLDSPGLPALPSLMWQHSIASYSDWDEDQKEELGGIEYRALKTLMVILVCYFIAFHLLGIILFIPWILLDPYYGQKVKDIGVNRSWWAIFTAGSAFHDLGYTLNPDSMGSFRNAAFPLLVMTFLVVIGNTGFPCMLRFIIWSLSKFTTYGSSLYDELHYLLEHPRRCFTMLFPGAETWRLGAVLLLLNALDLFIFYTLQENPQSNPFSPGLRLVDGLFQIASTRTAGFSITSLGTLHPAVQVSFVVMMYISAFPIAIAIRKTNVYEEKSLGIYDDEDKPNPHALASHIQRQLGFDLWYVMLGFFLIAVTEGKRIQQTHGQDPAFALFPLLFEIVSAYGTVGLSLGYPRSETSLSAQFNPVSKLIIIAMQVRGRHRGLPHSLDHAILLPCDVHQDQQGEWWWKRWLKRKSSGISNFFLHEDVSEDTESLPS
ncbi:low affinity potassium transporter [Aspergillus hancockii]|nr:low affinity potassium transporter [Aspergillus hancockii]